MEGQDVSVLLRKMSRVSVEVEVIHDQDAEDVALYAEIGVRRELRAQGCDVQGAAGNVEWEAPS
jgi:hypothetical protein